MNIAIIGASGHYEYALDGLSSVEGAAVIGIAPGAPGESIEELQRKLDQKGESPEVFGDYHTMLDRLSPECVVVNTLFNGQAEISAEALRRNIHVFSEKPLATTLTDLAALEEAHEQSTGELVAMLGLRYQPHFYTAWKAVRSGAVGDVRLINAQKSYKLGSREDFYKNRDVYGGTIPWVGIHGIDLIRWFADKRFLTVDAKHSRIANNKLGDLEATGFCLFTMDDEVIASLTIDYLRPENAESHGDDRIRVAGTHGIIEVIDERVMLINRDDQGTQELCQEDPGNIFKAFINDKTGTTLLGAEDSIEATRIALLARQSADEDMRISCTEEYKTGSKG